MANVAQRPAGLRLACARAKSLLGWEPQYDVAEGIRHSLQWAAIRRERLSGDVRL